MRPETKDIESIIREAIARYSVGRAEHGQLDLSQDRKDFISEAEQELLDCINYCVFQILRLRNIK
ncbi:MAG: hypothetical protein HZB32_00745 [Nitrospirae bacterium]|nr:hypothetical protein [Nitrospirota bacterium]